MLLAAPISAQSASETATAAPPPVTKPCDPVTPEVGPNSELVYTSCQIKAIGGTLPKLLSAPKDPDLSKLYQQGIQGQIYFDIIIGKNGILRDVSMQASSRSPELDAIGLELVQHSTFLPATDREGNPIEARAVYPTYFWKDRPLKDEFTKKKCDQFLIDAAWHQANFPEERPEQYRGWVLANGMIITDHILSATRGNNLNPGKRGNNLNSRTFSEVLEICRNNPKKLFLEAFQGKL